MELIQWRHAEAEEGVPDLERQLTEKGQRQAAKMAAFLRSRLPKNTRIIVSPALRAQQTAHALTRHFETEPRIGPGASAQAALEAAGWPDGDTACTLLVGHQPYLGEIAALLLTGSEDSFSIRKGAVWWLEQRDGKLGVRLVMSPDLV